MSYFAQPLNGFGRIFVDDVTRFGKIAWALSALPCAPIVLDWIQLNDQSSCGFGLSIKELVIPARVTPRFGAEFSFENASDAVSIIASNLSRIEGVSFDISAPATATELGERFAFTPNLGLFHGQLDHAGSHVYSEHRLMNILDRFREIGTSGCYIEMMDLLSTSWDKQLASDHDAFDLAQSRVRRAS